MQCPQRDSDSADIDIFWRMTQKRISRIPTWQRTFRKSRGGAWYSFHSLLLHTVTNFTVTVTSIPH